MPFDGSALPAPFAGVIVTAGPAAPAGAGAPPAAAPPAADAPFPAGLTVVVPLPVHPATASPRAATAAIPVSLMPLMPEPFPASRVSQRRRGGGHSALSAGVPPVSRRCHGGPPRSARRAACHTEGNLLSPEFVPVVGGRQARRTR